MKINEVSQQCEMTAQKIRFYEKEGLVCPRRDISNGYRIYSLEDIERLKEIKALRELDISLDDISNYFDGVLTLDHVFEKRIELARSQGNHVRDVISKCQLFLKHKESNMVGQCIYDIEDFLQVPEQVFEKVIKSSELVDLIKASKAVSPQLQTKIQACLPNVDFSTRRMEMGPVRLSEVERIHLRLIERMNEALVK